MGRAVVTAASSNFPVNPIITLLLWSELSTIGNNARFDMRLGVYNTEKKNINDKATIMLDTINEHGDVNQVCLCTTIHTTHRMTNMC